MPLVSDNRYQIPDSKNVSAKANIAYPIFNGINAVAIHHLKLQPETEKGEGGMEHGKMRRGEEEKRRKWENEKMRK